MSHVSKLPSSAVSAGGDDLVAPTAELLRGLSLLPTEEDMKNNGARAAFFGAPDSVAVIEAGATALSKGWAAGLGAVAAAIWAGVAKWWPGRPEDVQVAVIWGAAIATAALLGGLAYIVGSDVRGRAAASVATINARSEVAEAVIREAAELNAKKEERAAEEKAAADAAKAAKKAKAAKQECCDQVVPINPAQEMRWNRRGATDEQGWLAVALRAKGDAIEYWLMKGSVQEWVPSAEVERA